jgi:hypothetical protein
MKTRNKRHFRTSWKDGQPTSYIPRECGTGGKLENRDGARVSGIGRGVHNPPPWGKLGRLTGRGPPGCPRMAEVHAYGGRFRVRFMFLDGKECNTGTTITCSAGSSQTCDKSWTQDWDHRQHSEASLPGVARHAFHRPVAETHRATSTEDVEYEVMAWVSQNLRLGVSSASVSPKAWGPTSGVADACDAWEGSRKRPHAKSAAKPSRAGLRPLGRMPRDFFVRQWEHGASNTNLPATATHQTSAGGSSQCRKPPLGSHLKATGCLAWR